MSSPRVMMSRQNMVKPPQYVPEGHAPDTYGVVPNNPHFNAPGQRAWIESTPEPEFIDNEYGGSYDRQGIVKTREKNRLTYHSRMVPAANDIALLRAASALPADAAATPNESFTWLDSYKNSAGTEIFRVWRGCKPISSTVSITKAEPVMLDIEWSAQRFFETEALADAFALGNGALKGPLPAGNDFGAGAPLRFKDVGAFQYGSSELAYRSLTITTTYSQKVQDSNGLEYDAYCEPSARRITGSCDIFKSGRDLNEDARAGIQRPGYAVIRTSSDADAYASLGIGAGNFALRSRIPGAWGNQLKARIDIAKAGTDVNGEARVDGKTIYIEAPGALTNAKAKAAVLASREASDLVTVEGNVPAGNIAAKAETALAGGIDRGWKFVLERMRWMPSGEPLIDDSEATIESKSLEADVLTLYGA